MVFQLFPDNINSLLFQTEAEEAMLSKKHSKKVAKKYATRQRHAKVEPALEEQFTCGRLLGMIQLLFLR